MTNQFMHIDYPGGQAKRKTGKCFCLNSISKQFSKYLYSIAAANLMRKEEEEEEKAMIYNDCKETMQRLLHCTSITPHHSYSYI